MIRAIWHRHDGEGRPIESRSVVLERLLWFGDEVCGTALLLVRNPGGGGNLPRSCVKLAELEIDDGDEMAEWVAAQRAAIKLDSLSRGGW